MEEVAARPSSGGGALPEEGTARARLPLEGSDLCHLWSIPLLSTTCFLPLCIELLQVNLALSFQTDCLFSAALSISLPLNSVRYLTSSPRYLHAGQASSCLELCLLTL